MAMGKETPPCQRQRDLLAGGFLWPGRVYAYWTPSRVHLHDKYVASTCGRVPLRQIRFQYKYVLSTLLDIIHVVRITNYVLSTYLYLQILSNEYRSDTAFHARPERALRPGSAIMTIVRSKPLAAICEPSVTARSSRPWNRVSQRYSYLGIWNYKYVLRT